MLDGERAGRVLVRGHRLYYRRFGTGARGTVLVLHGGPGLTHDYLLPMADLAVHGYGVVLYDQFGCGSSGRPRTYRTVTIQEAAADADALRRALRLGRVHLYGHSYGGALALETALRFPRGWRSLLVSGGFASMDALWRGLRRRLAELSAPSRRALVQEDEDGISTRASRRADEEFRQRFSHHLRNVPYEVWRTYRRANPRVSAAMGMSARHTLRDGYRTGTLAGWDVTGELGRIRLPTLLTVGEFDHVHPDVVRAIHRGIPGARFALARGEGHLPMFEARDRYISQLRGFLDAVG